MPGGRRYDTPAPSSRTLPEEAPLVLTGIVGAPGVAIGRALVIHDARSRYVQRRIEPNEREAESLRLLHATEKAKVELRTIAKSVQSSPEQASILEAYLAMLSDPMLQERTRTFIREEFLAAEWAVDRAANEIMRRFDNSNDSYIAERRHDIEFIADRIIRELSSLEHPTRPEEPVILVAKDLSPADTAALVGSSVLGFVTSRGSRTSHTAIMARALGIPAVVGVASPEFTSIRTGDLLILDALKGTVTAHPSASTLTDAERRGKKHDDFARDLKGHAKEHPNETKCGEKVELKANIELAHEVTQAVEAGADGIGLYRTEFVYIARKTLPSEEEQYEIYSNAVRQMGQKTVTLRTFDLGGDKFASSLLLPSEMNPALGLRATRLALRSPEVFRTQLRAMLRASKHGPVRIMLPMVTTLVEVRAVREIAMEESRSLGFSAFPVPLGMMVEVPAAAIRAEQFAREVDFFSIGTNDLVQYTLAVDRTNRELANLASPLEPAILELIAKVVAAGKAHNRPVGLCGAMAQDPLGVVLLLGLGLRRYSMGPGAIPLIKETLARVTVAEAAAAATKALAADTAADVEQLLLHQFGDRLSDILDATTARSS